jgi:hypothetical protein
MTVAVTNEEPLPVGTEERLAGFTELVATAIANAQAQAELTASRARIVATADQTRRRIERDLHDGAQQRLVSLVLQLRAVKAAIPAELKELAAELDGVAAGMDGALEDLREFARGIHPAILAEGGLGPALRTLARRAPVPVQLQVLAQGRLPEPVEVAAYYVVAEALANAAKHARAAGVTVEVEEAADGVLRVGVMTTGSAAPTWPAARAWSASRTAWRRSAGASQSRARAGRHLRRGGAAAQRRRRRGFRLTAGGINSMTSTQPQAYRTKYAHRARRYVDPMVSPTATAATLRLIPR